MARITEQDDGNGDLRADKKGQRWNGAHESNERATHIITISAREGARNREKHRDLLPLRTSQRVPHEMSRQVAILERESVALSPRGLLPRRMRMRRLGILARRSDVGKDGLPGLSPSDAVEVGADEGDNLVVVEAVVEAVGGEDDEARGVRGWRLGGGGDGEEGGEGFARGSEALGEVDGDDFGRGGDLCR